MDRAAAEPGAVHELYSDVCLVFAHTSPGEHVPNIFDERNFRYVIPEDAQVQVLFQSNHPADYRLEYGEVPSGVPDWKVFGNP